MDIIYRCKDCNRLMTIRTYIDRKRVAECRYCGERIYIDKTKQRNNGQYSKDEL